ncbi:FAD-dependent thymidylate synthase [Candidatus Uhrbacteria bacterium]|nr:FAD-dependent thymidylate synthase [Candidatus Uhrbacteria bacterium]
MEEPPKGGASAKPSQDMKPRVRDPIGTDGRRIYWLNRIELEREDGGHVTIVPTPEQLAVAIAKCSRSSTPFDRNIDEVSLEKAADFHEKWVVGYGHSSVAEHAVASVAFQNIPQTVIKILEDSRLASFTEKSSRYQVFTRDRVSVPATLVTSPHGPKVAELFDHLYGLYDSLFPELTALMRGRFPKTDEMTDGAYNAATKARVCDVVRYLLPAAALGSLGMTANARTWEHVIMKLLSSPDAVARQVGRELKTVLKGASDMDKELALREKPLPTLLKYADPKPYLTDTPVVLEQLARELMDGIAAEGRVATPERPVVMTKDDPEAEIHVAAAILTRFGGTPYAATLKRLRGDGPAVERVLRAAVADRGPHDAPLRELEHAWFQHEIVMDYGAWRDVQRHRICTQTNQPLGTDLGYDIPEEIETVGHSGEWRYVLDEAALLHDALVADGFGTEATYVVPMAYRRRMLVGWNLRELFHFIELRSGKKGHPSYRRIAQELWRTIQETHPLLAAFIRVDLSDETTSTLGGKPKGF